MVRIHHDDKSGFVNEGLEVFENNDDCGSTAPTIFSHNTTNDTKIQITRSKYNQESLNREMVYRKSPTKSCESKSTSPIEFLSLYACSKVMSKDVFFFMINIFFTFGYSVIYWAINCSFAPIHSHVYAKVSFSHEKKM